MGQKILNPSVVELIGKVKNLLSWDACGRPSQIHRVSSSCLPPSSRTHGRNVERNSPLAAVAMTLTRTQQPSGAVAFARAFFGKGAAGPNEVAYAKALQCVARVKGAHLRATSLADRLIEALMVLSQPYK